MGNDTLSTKYKVLEVLRANSGPVSGEAIASEKGVSRVSVWKAVQALQAAGYGISSAKDGYCLTKDLKDSLYPWEFGAQESLFEHFSETESTMNEARRIVESEGDSGVARTRIITADRQTKGQGQNNHSWTTTEGSLACTVITQNHIPTAAYHRVTMAAQVALVDVLTAQTGRRFYVRWPNDIWTDEGKVGGILDELSSVGNVCKWITVGIGLNMTSRPRIPQSDCVSSDGTLSRKELLSLFWDAFQAQEKSVQDDSDELAAKWNSMCSDCGKKVRFSGDGEEHIFTKINGWGWAEFASSDGKKKTVLPPGAVRFVKSK